MTAENDQINLRDIFMTLWKDKLWIIGITFAFAVISVIYAMSLQNVYTAETKVVATEEARGGGLSGMTGQLQGLASLAGLSTQLQETDKQALALEVMMSREFLTNFVEQHNLLPYIMAYGEWNHRAQEGSLDPEIYDENAQKWLREVEAPWQPKPNPWEYIPILKEMIEVLPGQAGVVTVSVTHPSPVVAHEILTNLINDINSVMRIRDIQEAERSLDFLNSELEKTAYANMQQVFYQLIEKQTQTIMLANARPEYIFQIVDPAVVPLGKSGPSRPLICIIITFLGGILSVMFVLIRNYLK